VRILHYSAVLGTMSVHIFFDMKEQKAAGESKLRLRLCPLLMPEVRKFSLETLERA
jgi:hypothetical protein